MFNLASKIRHCCPLYGCVPLIFEWRGRYMFFCTHLEAPYADTRERKHGISGAEWLRTFGKGTGNDLDHTKFWKARIKSFEALNQIIERIGREDLPDWMLEKYMEQPPKPGRR